MGLSVCATPIGNLDDVTLRVLEELGEADAVLCEDTRRTAILLDRHGIRARSLLSYHRHNEAKRVAEVVPRLVAGERIALVSDAGLPGINDPGARIVAAAIAAGAPVTVLPGASAVETALVLSGYGETPYRFVGYLPRRSAELDFALADVLSSSVTTVAFESPRRLPTSLARLAALEAARQVVVCRELTKRYEEVVRGTAAEVAARYGDAPRGEITLVVAARTPNDDPDLEAAHAAVAELVAAGTPRRVAAEVVARLAGASKNTLYRASL